MQPQAQKLRDLFAAGEHFIAADCYSALTARIVEQVGFKAAYLGGHACSAFHYAVPDNGIFSQVEQIEQASRIAAAIDIPLIADADTLGETVADAFHFARRYSRSGVAGIHIEDETNPKHSTFNNDLLPIADMQARIEATVKGAGDSGLVVIARCDELYAKAIRGAGGGSVEEAIKRGRAYLEAGADALCFPIGSVEAIQQIKQELKAPMVILGMPVPGMECTLHTGWGWMGAAQLHLQRAKELFETGSISNFTGRFDEKNALIEQDFYDQLVADWAKKTGRPVR